MLFFRNLVSDKQDSLAQCADFRTSLPSQEAMLCSGPLAVIQGRTSKYARVTFVFGFCHVLHSQASTTELLLEMPMDSGFFNPLHACSLYLNVVMRLFWRQENML